MNNYYFEEPTLGFYIDHNGDPILGIGYRDEVICQCCGAVHSIEDVIENANQFNYSKAFYAYNSWADGIDLDLLPDGLCFIEFPYSECRVIVEPNIGE